MNKKMLSSLSLIIFISFILSACANPYINVTRGSGELTSQNREVSEFDAIQIDGAGELIIIQGERESLEIEAETNIIDKLTSQVQDNILVLGYQESSWRNTVIPTKRIVYTVTLTDLSRVTINGAADLKIDTLETDTLSLNINGAGQIKISQLLAERLDVNIAGTTNMEIAGQASEQSITIDGAGNYKAGDFKTSTTKVDISGLGNATVWATENLEINLDGGGNLRYYGSPNVTQDVTGLGEIESLGEK
jgi:hypothetical protein